MGGCKELAATWREVAEELDEKKREGMGVNVNMATVDLGKSPELKKRFKIKSTAVPHLALFRHKKMYVYTGAHKKDALVDFATGGYDSSPGLPVPPELTIIDTIKD